MCEAVWREWCEWRRIVGEAVTGKCMLMLSCGLGVVSGGAVI